VNEVRVSARAAFNPGPKKPTPVRVTVKAAVKIFTYGVPKATVKTPRVKVNSAKPAVFSPGAVKAVPVRVTAKAKVKTTRVTAKATAKPRNFVVRQTAKSRAGLALSKGALAKPHDSKTVVGKMTIQPAAPKGRNYVAVGRAISHVTYLRPLVPHDRKTAVSKAVFGSFNPRPPAFRWH
jgi:hypothetical protein